MKQRVVVQAIIRQGDEVLLLKRATGRPELIGMYELPGGRLDENEQPEDALRRYIKTQLGQDLRTFKLMDVLAMIHQEESGIQHVFILYSIDSLSPEQPIQLNPQYDQYVWSKLSELHQLKLRDSAEMLLKSLQQPHTTEVSVKQVVVPIATKETTQSQVIIFSDGGSRGNPGESAAAFVIMDQTQRVIDQGGEYLGITTNNQAEYHGVRLGLERAKELGIKKIEFHIDSLLVVNQMRGIYKIKNRELWPINERIIGLLPSFDKVTFVHVDRGQNQQADSLVNKILDEHEDGNL